MRVFTMIVRYMLLAMLGILSLETPVFAEEPISPQESAGEIGITALVLGLFTPESSSAGLAFFFDRSHLLGNHLAGVIALGGGPIAHEEGVQALTAIHGGLRWEFVPQQAFGVRIGGELIFDPETQTALTEYGVGVDIEYLYHFEEAFFLITSIGIGASWIYEEQTESHTSEPFPHVSWTNGLGTEITL